MKLLRPLLALLAAGTTLAAHAQLTIGVSLPLTGPGSGLGIPVKRYLDLWPQTIAGQKINLIVLDDATDPTNGARNAKRFTSEDKVDLIIGSVNTPVAAPIAAVAAEAKTVQIALSPVPLPDDHWTFRMPQANTIMAAAVARHMQAQKVKSVGILAYSDSYGDVWIKDLGAAVAKLGIPVVATERFARADTSVTAQALRLASVNPDAILVVASGSGSAMPQMGLVERGYKGKIYQTHASATRDLMRLGGKAVEGGYVVASPAVVAMQLPTSNPSKKEAMAATQKYEAAYGAGSLNPASAHAHDVLIILEKVVPIAMKKGKPGTAEFRDALRDALETTGPYVLSHGVLNWTKTDHWGYAEDTGVILKIVDGDWKIE
jgi:branched-chain amino acid transport system substrate-binding protein